MTAPRVETYTRADGLYDWRLIAGNGEQVCESSQGYTSRSDAERGFGAAVSLLELHARATAEDGGRLPMVAVGP